MLPFQRFRGMAPASGNMGFVQASLTRYGYRNLCRQGCGCTADHSKTNECSAIAAIKMIALDISSFLVPLL
jgi:hypothetical protein